MRHGLCSFYCEQVQELVSAAALGALLELDGDILKLQERCSLQPYGDQRIQGLRARVDKQVALLRGSSVGRIQDLESVETWLGISVEGFTKPPLTRNHKEPKVQTSMPNTLNTNGGATPNPLSPIPFQRYSL